jgi:hypothetical protein
MAAWKQNTGGRLLAGRDEDWRACNMFRLAVILVRKTCFLSAVIGARPRLGWCSGAAPRAF